MQLNVDKGTHSHTCASLSNLMTTNLRNLFSFPPILNCFLSPFKTPLPFERPWQLLHCCWFCFSPQQRTSKQLNNFSVSISKHLLSEFTWSPLPSGTIDTLCALSVAPSGLCLLHLISSYLFTGIFLFSFIYFCLTMLPLLNKKTCCYFLPLQNILANHLFSLMTFLGSSLQKNNYYQYSLIDKMVQYSYSTHSVHFFHTLSLSSTHSIYVFPHCSAENYFVLVLELFSLILFNSYISESSTKPLSCNIFFVSL